MALKPPPLGELLQQINEMVGNSPLKGEVDRSVRALTQSALGRLELVTREEFDAQAEILQRACAKVASLELELEELSRELEQLSDQP